jgi:dihydroorotate dehydrogenase electron transfer subunit
VNNRITLEIAEVIKETSDINTYKFKHDLKAKPGQFIMLSDLQGGEKPFSISECTEEYFCVTVKRIGEFTTRLFSCSAGDLLSIRGPFGSSFFISDGKVLLVGGGYGTPPLYFLTKQLLENGAEVHLINGARNSEELVFCDKFRELDIIYSNISECGKLQNSGTSVDLTLEEMKANKFDHIYAAGPEMMMKNLQSVLKEESYEFLFERYMKCAIGICGNCTIDPLGIRLCVEGPVLPRKLVEQLTEFGSYHREASGKRIYFNK